MEMNREITQINENKWAHSKSCSKLNMITVQCTFFFFFFQRKVPLIANYNMDKTAPTKMLEKEGV